MNEHSDMHYTFSAHQPSTMNTRECNYDISRMNKKILLKTVPSFMFALQQRKSFTSSNTLETTCLSRTGMYLVPRGTAVGAKASMMVSRLATKP